MVLIADSDLIFRTKAGKRMLQGFTEDIHLSYNKYYVK